MLVYIAVHPQVLNIMSLSLILLFTQRQRYNQVVLLHAIFTHMLFYPNHGYLKAMPVLHMLAYRLLLSTNCQVFIGLLQRITLELMKH